MTSNSNGCYYLIGDCIEFRPEDNLLYSRINGEKVTLFVAASRCLQLLLNQQGKLVSQKELFEVGWQKNGMGVSNNTFYQNILMLRKGFKLAGYEQAVIKTVPRQGLTVPLAVHVEKILPDSEIDRSKEQPIIEGNIPLFSSHKTKKKPALSLHLWVWGLSLSLCVGVMISLIWNSAEESDFFSSFSYIGKVEQCSVYLNDNQTALKSYMQLNAKNKFTCNKKRFVYFTTYPLVPRASAIRCERPFSPGIKNSCTSEYFLEWKSNE
ncbi:DNA-binding winged helix-turn-helix (wHTH) protein [Serratia fonticola]|uniref:DNA-binding winged helix-turn-helix (WHTH) protein n=1 Tax=Serratia fonticola TaxID=47917 RepID=A0A542BK21_SERFO|nr:winged helix-turn-helix domain-containing protein [Serratia fonticola]TQI78931.1 DNA-binding winged helix-turn-helix (wHTH) protein [Serratia fonticola]TQI99046.1 DNA-binding winged helix-turn-helix (wHTH) protein [Serratia fonticola]TVZ68571.1 DNA-binding winged helix-turn-helix (wHTH) protein [Serratia fonticola]